MPDSITGILDYTPPPDEETFRKRRKLLIIAVIVSLVMTVIGYFMILKALLS